MPPPSELEQLLRDHVQSRPACVRAFPDSAPDARRSDRISQPRRTPRPLRAAAQNINRRRSIRSPLMPPPPTTIPPTRVAARWRRRPSARERSRSCLRRRPGDRLDSSIPGMFAIVPFREDALPSHAEKGHGRFRASSLRTCLLGDDSAPRRTPKTVAYSSAQNLFSFFFISSASPLKR